MQSPLTDSNHRPLLTMEAVGLGEHCRAALLAHLTREGLYLTSQREPGWVRDRVVMSEANGLVGVMQRELGEGGAFAA